jgi:dTDP-4-dehydrorhamnose reductase
MSRILLLGKNGQVGYALGRRLAALGDLQALDAEDLDLTRAGDIRDAVRALRPQLIVNAAAYTAVDQAEEQPALALAVNGEAPKVLAEEAAKAGAALVHYSTEYVFDGAKDSPYTEDDIPNPLGVYGRSKLAGDRAIIASGVPYLIFRTTWVYGLRGHNFLLTMQRLLRERDEVRVVGDQIGAPTWSESLAEATVAILEQAGCDWVRYIGANRGLYNMTCGGATSWFGFAGAIRDHMVDQESTLGRLVEIRSTEYPTPARRPPYSVLDNSRLRQTFGVSLPAWDDALARCLRGSPPRRG